MWKIAITGHRPDKLYGYNLYNSGWIELGRKIRNFLLGRLEEKKEIECITGMALGVDQLYGLVALKLKNEGHKVRIFAAIPCKDQEKMWKSKEYYDKILNNSDEIFFVSNEPYTNYCMQNRNKFMAARCDELLAIWNGTPGGTCNCITYTKSIGKPIINLFEKEL